MVSQVINSMRETAGYVIKPIKRAGTEIEKRVDKEMRHNFKANVYKAGSYLVEPFCKCRQYAYEISLSNAELNPKASPAYCLAMRVGRVCGIVLLGAVGMITTPIGLALRAIASSLEDEPFIFKKAKAPSEEIPKNREISLISWNACMVGGGYSITDGGVTPPLDRVKEAARAIADAEPTIFCGQEFFDVVTTEAWIYELKKVGYTHFYYNIGPRALGMSSGLFVASKVEIGYPRFELFDKSTLVGRTKFAQKGVFSFDVLENGNVVATVHNTHLQHSEEVSSPNTEEVTGRFQQMKVIKQLAQTPAIPTIICGDLNMNDAELMRQELLDKDKGGFAKGDTAAIGDEVTYQGDTWVAKKMNKKAAGAQNLDYILSNKPIKTRIPFEIHHDPKKYSHESISDHKPLLSVFKV